MKCHESLRNWIGFPLRRYFPPSIVHSRQPKRSALRSMSAPFAESETTSELRFGVSGVQRRSASAATGISIVTILDDLASTSTLPKSFASFSAPSSHAGTGAERTSVPARLIHSQTFAPRSALAAASPAFATVTSSARTPFETSGRTNTSSTRSFGRDTSVTSCQMPMISPPHMEPAGITRRPTPSRSSKSFCPRTPTRSSNVSPGFTRSVTSASNGRNSSKFSATFLPFTRTTHSPATASKRTAMERPDQSDGTVTERRIQPIL